VSQQGKTDLHRQFASRLKAIRLRGGMSQAALAQFLGIPASRIGNWEAGRNGPNPSSLGTIAQKLSVSVEFLSGSDGYEGKNLLDDHARDAAPRANPKRSDRLVARIEELSDVEYARTEAALMGVIDAVLSARPLRTPISQPSKLDHAVEMAAMDLGRLAVQIVRGKTGESESPTLQTSQPSDDVVPPSDPQATDQGADPKKNRNR